MFVVFLEFNQQKLKYKWCIDIRLDVNGKGNDSFGGCSHDD